MGHEHQQWTNRLKKLRKHRADRKVDVVAQAFLVPGQTLPKYHLIRKMIITDQVIIMMVVWRTIWAADFVKTDREFKMRDLKSNHLIEIDIFSVNTFKMKLKILMMMRRRHYLATVSYLCRLFWPLQIWEIYKDDKQSTCEPISLTEEIGSPSILWSEMMW